jgi:hypothetical protein
MLCFIVPTFMLAVEEVVYSNLATVITAQIQKNHEFDVKDAGSQKVVNVYAQSARALPVDPKKPLIQTVELIGATLVTYATPDNAHPTALIPKNFWMAREAWLSIERFDMVGGNVSNAGPHAVPVATITVQLQDGMEFPRLLGGDVQAGVAQTDFGPVEIPAPVRESVKFMDVKRLTDLVSDPGQGRSVQTTMRWVTAEMQQREFLKDIARELAPDSEQHGTYEFPPDSNTGQIYSVAAPANANIVISTDGEELTVSSNSPQTDDRPITMTETGGASLKLTAKVMHVSCVPDIVNQRLNVILEFFTTRVYTQQAEPSEQLSNTRTFSIPTPPDIKQIEDLTLTDLRSDPRVIGDEHNHLRHEQIVVANGVASELHSRASFAISCLALVMMGTALGMMFRSGNFMNAFAVCFGPALLCITMIVCGQSIAMHVPYDEGLTVRNPLLLGLWFIWSGNILVMTVAGFLTVRLSRQ